LPQSWAAALSSKAKLKSVNINRFRMRTANGAAK
jgi:hypothetical protein